MKYLTNIDLQKNELQNAAFHKLGSAPSNPVEGQVYQNTVDHKDYIWNGTIWVDKLARANHSGTQTASTISDFSTAADARITNAVGVSVQAYDADLGTIAGLSPSNDDFLQRKSGAWANRTVAQVKSDLGLTGINSGDQDLSGYFSKSADDTDDITVGATNKFATAAEKTKLGHITVTQAVDLDAIETRVNDLDAAVVLRGVWDASAGTFPGGGTAQAGSSYIVSVGGTVNSVVFSVNDRIIAITDNASTTTYAANWHKADYTDSVLSVNGDTGVVVLDKADVGLGNVDNTSDATKNSAAATLTNKTIDADGTGNVITNIGASEIKADIITGLTAETAINDADVIMIYDASATALRKMTKANFVAGLSSTPSVYSATIGDASATSFTITQATHGKAANSSNRVDVEYAATGERVVADVTVAPATGNVTIAFAVAPASNEFRVHIS